MIQHSFSRVISRLFLCLLVVSSSGCTSVITSVIYESVPQNSESDESTSKNSNSDEPTADFDNSSEPTVWQKSVGRISESYDFPKITEENISESLTGYETLEEALAVSGIDYSPMAYEPVSYVNGYQKDTFEIVDFRANTGLLEITYEDSDGNSFRLRKANSVRDLIGSDDEPDLYEQQSNVGEVPLLLEGDLNRYRIAEWIKDNETYAIVSDFDLAEDDIAYFVYEGTPVTNQPMPEENPSELKTMVIEDGDWFIQNVEEPWTDTEERVSVNQGSPEPNDGKSALLMAHQGYYYGDFVGTLNPGDTIEFNRASYTVEWRIAMDQTHDNSPLLEANTEDDSIYLLSCIEGMPYGWTWFVYAREN